MNYTLYRTATGEIFQNGWGDPPEVEGMAWIAGQYDGSTHYIDAEEQPQLLPERPGPWAQWTRQGWIDPRTPGDLVAEITAARLSAVAAINTARGEARSRFITAIPGQDMVYLEKEREAREWVAARASGTNAPNPADFPHLAAECGITASDMDSVAQVYLNMAAMFRQVSAVIEAVSMAAIAAAESAPTPEAAAEAAAAFPSTLAGALSQAGVPI